MANKDMVNNPAHYDRKGGMKCIDEMILIFGEKETAIFCKINAWKYRYRAGQKEGEDGLQDLQKSDWYIAKYKELKEMGQYSFITTSTSCSPQSIIDVNCTKK